MGPGREPKNHNTLYASAWNRIRQRWSDPVPGGEDGLYKTTDGVKTWHLVGSGLPNTYVWDLIIHPRDNTLVIATNGRGTWAIDDVSKIQNFK